MSFRSMKEGDVALGSEFEVELVWGERVLNEADREARRWTISEDIMLGRVRV